MSKRWRGALIPAALAIVVATMVPASAHQVDLVKAAVDFGSCREVTATKTVRVDAVTDYLPGDRLPVGDTAEVVIRALRCRWLEAKHGDRVGHTRRPIIIQVGIASPSVSPVAVAPGDLRHDIYTLFTVTNSRALAHAARAAGFARVHVTDNVRFVMGRADTCGQEVRTVVAVRDDRAPSFVMKGLVNAPGPGCDRQGVGAVGWWTQKGDVASVFLQLAHRQSVVASQGQLEVWAARNTRLPLIVGSAHFTTDTTRTGHIAGGAATPDVVIVPHLMAV